MKNKIGIEKIGIAIFFVIIIIAVILVIALNSTNEPEDPYVPPETKLETGLDLDEKTAGWAVTQGLSKAQEWRGDARLAYLEWRNVPDDGVMDESDAVDCYFSSEWTEMLYKVVVDVDGATDYELKEVEASKIFKNNTDSFIFNWTQDSDVMLKKAKGEFIKDSEEMLRFTVIPARTLDLGINSNLAIVLVYTTEQDIYYNGNTGALIEKRVVLTNY